MVVTQDLMLGYIKRAGVIILLGIVSTVLSYQIITGRNVPEAAEVYSLSGGYTVALPCAALDMHGWDGTRPTLPEARGLPFTYNWYSPCEGNIIIRKSLILNIVCWSVLYLAVYLICIQIKKHQENLRSSKIEVH